jgi:hypothetical protein
VRRLLDGLGWPERGALALLLAWVAWAGGVGVAAGHLLPPTAYVLAPLALVIGVVMGRLVAERARPSDVQGTLLVVATILFLGVVSSPEPGKAPLVYPNANAALAVQVIGLCGLALLGTNPRSRPRLVVVTAALIATAAVVANASTGALAVALPLLAVIAVATWGRVRRRWWAVLGGAAVILVVAGQVVRLADLADWPGWASAAIDSTRRSLWRDATALWSRHPAVGSGPGSFARFSPLAEDPDTSAAHSSVLQVGAETGWVGVAIVGLVVLAGLLWAARGTARYAVVAAAAWTALVVQSLTDHLLDFPPVVLAAGLVLGWAAATGRSEELDVAEGERPGPG